MKYLLDTNICVHFLRGKFEMDKILKEKGRRMLTINQTNQGRSQENQK